MKPDDRRKQLQRDWANLLGNVKPGKPQLNGEKSAPESLGEVQVERLHLTTEPGIVVPTLLLLPPMAKGQRPSVVVGVSQHGKQEFLMQRSTEIADLLRAGVAVCLPDVRGTGETSTADIRDRRSSATATAAGELRQQRETDLPAIVAGVCDPGPRWPHEDRPHRGQLQKQGQHTLVDHFDANA